jgi:Heterokaryon incompatibility protein (HET)
MVTKGRLGRWVALSHCWGTSTPFTTTTSNLADRQRSIPFDDFPKTFQDAITICRRLGFEYLWIDSLCILQDSQSDWGAESAQMSRVYSNASITLIAEASTDSSSGIFATRNSGRLSPQAVLPVPCIDSQGAYCGTIYPQKFNTGGGPVGSYEEGPLSSRAWALQEDVLSKRILRYSRDQLFWACRTSFRSESNPNSFEDHQKIYDPRNFRRHDMSDNRRLLTFWYEILNKYYPRSLTFERDKFPAISGIAREIAALTNYSYKAGIWQEDAHLGLLWSSTGSSKRTSRYIAPSWSWASLIKNDNKRVFLNDKAYRVTEKRAEILQIGVTNVEADTYGQVTSAFLKIQSKWRSIDAWDLNQAEISTSYSREQFHDSPPTFRRIRIFFDVDVTREPLGQDIICVQIARAEWWGQENQKREDRERDRRWIEAMPWLAMPWLDNERAVVTLSPGRLWAWLLKPTNRGGSENEYQRLGLAVIPRTRRFLDEGWEEGWEKGTFTII